MKNLIKLVLNYNEKYNFFYSKLSIEEDYNIDLYKKNIEYELIFLLIYYFYFIATVFTVIYFITMSSIISYNFYSKMNQLEEEEDKLTFYKLNYVKNKHIKDDDCCICLMSLKEKNNRVIALTCSHQIHYKCFKLFIKLSNDNIHLEDHFRIYDIQFFKCPICSKCFYYKL